MSWGRRLQSCPPSSSSIPNRCRLPLSERRLDSFSQNLAKCQALVVAYDHDTAVLGLRLSDGAEYQVTNAGHAQIIRKKISPGGMISIKQYDWLERYRVFAKSNNRARLLMLLKSLRQEIRNLSSRG